MSFNGSGVFLINTVGQPVVSGTLIQSSVFNTIIDDIASGLSGCITKDGQTVVTANIPMGGFKLTGLGSGAVAGDAISYTQLTTLPTLGIVAPGGSLPLLTLTGTGGAGGMTYMLFAENGYTEKFAVGMLGVGEGNISWNMDYSSGIHRFYNNTLNAFWLAMNTNGVYMQYAPATVAAGDVWDLGGDLYTFVSKPTGEFFTGGSISAQQGISSSGQVVKTESYSNVVMEACSTTYATLGTVSTRGDGVAQPVGRLTFTYTTNNANQRTLAYIETTTNGATPNQRGGKVTHYTKVDGGIGFNTCLAYDASGNVYLPTDKTTASSANVFWDAGIDGALKRFTSLEEFKNRQGPLTVEDSKKVIFGADWFEYLSKIETDDQEKLWVGTGARGMFKLDKRFVHYNKNEPSGVQYDRFVAPLSVISRDHEKTLTKYGARVRSLEKRIARLEAH